MNINWSFRRIADLFTVFTKKQVPKILPTKNHNIPANRSVIVALVIGHKETSPGACNKESSVCEYDFCRQLVNKIVKQYDGPLSLRIVYRQTYRDLPDKINKLNPAFVISFHNNAYNGQASGTATLYYHKSSIGRRMAAIVQKNIVGSIGLKDRGIKPKTSEDRGGYLLRYTKAPAIITEPFFLDNDSDYLVVSNKTNEIIGAYSQSITEIAEKLFNLKP